MKKFFRIILVTIFIFSIFIISKVNSDYNYDKIELIEKYVKNYKRNIKKVTNKYKIRNTKELEETISSINSIINIIKRAKEIKLSKEKRYELIQYITRNLKEINIKSREILKKGKREFDRKLKIIQEPYSEAGKKISQQLDFLTSLVYRMELSHKKVYSLKNSILKGNLERIEAKSKEFKNYGNISFNSEEEMKIYFKKLKEETKKEVILLRERLKKD